MTKNQKRKHQQVPGTQNDSKISLPTVFKNETIEKANDFAKVEDFPQLPTSKVGGNYVFPPQSSSSTSNCPKSWLSIVSKDSLRNAKEEYPYLPGSKYKHRGDNFNIKKDDEKPPPITKIETAEKLIINVETINPTKTGEGQLNIVNQIPVQQYRNPHKKKRSDPIVFHFQDIYSVQNKKKVKKQNVFKSKFQRHGNKELLSGNYLDSSNPIRSRGKHREIKKKKLTKLKLATIKERIIKEKIKEKGIANYLTEEECFQVIEKLDFKTELKLYLEKLNKRRAQKSEDGKNQLNGSLKVEKGEKQTLEITSGRTDKKKENGGETTAGEIKQKKIPQVFSGGEIKFTTKFREYCDNILTPALNTSVSELIKELVKLQDRQFARDPIKAKAKRRHVSGIREAKKYLTLKKTKLIIIAPNLEKLQMEGGLYDVINELKSMALEQNVPYGFALDRFGLGRCTKKNLPVSAVAVLNHEGVEALFENTIHHLKEAKESFLKMAKVSTRKAEDEEKEEVNDRMISSLMSVFREGLQISHKNDHSLS